MIHWLLQTRAAHPDLARGVPPVSLLSAAETAVFNALKTEKRRRDWLLGRWTAKQLIQTVVKQEKDVAIALEDFSILAGADGAPIINSQWPIVNGQWSISISHARETAFCALVEQPSWPIGADIEWIEPRSERFVTDYFTKVEQALVAETGSERRDLLVTAVWSAKEAALKAIHQGLKVDTRCVTCLPNLAMTDDDWMPFVMQWDPRRIQNPPTLHGWWRQHNNFVLTITAQPKQLVRSIFQ